MTSLFQLPVACSMIYLVAQTTGLTTMWSSAVHFLPQTMAELRQRGEGPYVSSSSTSIPSTNKKSYDKEDDIVVDIRERDRDGDRDSIRKASSTSPSPPVGSYTLRSPSSFGDGPFRLKSLQNVPVQWMVTLKAMCLSFYAEGRRFAQQQNRVVAVVVFLWLFFIMTKWADVLLLPVSYIMILYLRRRHRNVHYYHPPLPLALSSCGLTLYYFLQLHCRAIYAVLLSALRCKVRRQSQRPLSYWCYDCRSRDDQPAVVFSYLDCPSAL